eukprot:5343228-Prymnesium_polylepis.1
MSRTPSIVKYVSCGSRSVHHSASEGDDRVSSPICERHQDGGCASAEMVLGGQGAGGNAVCQQR